MTKHLNGEDLTRIASRLLDHARPPGRDRRLLESIATRSKASPIGTGPRPTPHETVAALTQALASECTRIDGNLRLAFMAAYVMYAYNGYDLVPPSVEEGDAVLRSIARGELDVPQIAEIMSTWTHALTA